MDFFFIRSGAIYSFFIWRLWPFFFKTFSSSPSNFLDSSPNPITLGLEDTLSVSSRMMSSDLWLDQVVGPTYLFIRAAQGRLGFFFLLLIWEFLQQFFVIGLVHTSSFFWSSVIYFLHDSSSSLYYSALSGVVLCACNLIFFSAGRWIAVCFFCAEYLSALS